MSRLPKLRLPVEAETLWPGDAAFMARTDLVQTRMLGYTPFNLDAVTTLLLGVLGSRPSVRHVSSTTDEILGFLSDAGLAITEDIHRFSNGEQAEAIADRLVNDGHRLFWPYPLREGRFADDAHLVPPELWRRLNNKDKLHELVPPEALATRRVASLADCRNAAGALPVYLKAAGISATGWGYAVRFCDSSAALDAALSDFRELGHERVIVEDAIDLVGCWCVNLAIDDSRTHYLGAAEQIFGAPARQSGSVIDPDNPFPEAGVPLACEVGERARGLGFRGLCGLDIGLAHDSRLVVFDPNFRFNSSSGQVLLHPAAAERSGFQASLSFFVSTEEPVSRLIERMSSPVAEGWLVPTRLIDATLMPAAEGRSCCSGFVMGSDRTDAETRLRSLQTRISS